MHDLPSKCETNELQDKSIENEGKENDSDTTDTKEDTKFYTSTPKKTFPCEDCRIGSKCVDCIVLHTLGRHGVVREIFQ